MRDGKRRGLITQIWAPVFSNKLCFISVELSQGIRPKGGPEAVPDFRIVFFDWLCSIVPRYKLPSCPKLAFPIDWPSPLAQANVPLDDAVRRPSRVQALAVPPTILGQLHSKDITPVDCLLVESYIFPFVQMGSIRVFAMNSVSFKMKGVDCHAYESGHLSWHIKVLATRTTKFVDPTPLRRTLQHSSALGWVHCFHWSLGRTV